MNHQGNSHAGQDGRRFIAAAYLTILILSVLMLAGTASRGEMTRSEVRYIGDFEGDGEADDILLAGYRWYNCSFTFIDWVSEVEKALVIMSHGDITGDLFDYNLSTQELNVLDTSGMIDVKEPLLIQLGGNLTLSFKIWVHLNWTFETNEIELEPVIWSDGVEVALDFLERLEFNIDGRLEPIGDRIMLIDTFGRSLITGGSVRSGSSISVTGISFQYNDPAGRFAGLEPAPSEISPVVIANGATVNTTYRTGGYIADVQMPDLEVGEVEISLLIPGIRDRWVSRIDDWTFTVSLDGIGPKIDLIRPLSEKILGETIFEWNISLIDKPLQSGIMVNGSSVDYRVWTGTDNWTAWMDADAVASGISIHVTGTGQGERGKGNTLIQFRARDELGNVNISDQFPVRINVGPVINIPDDLDGMVLMNNMSLVLDGEEMASDPDGTALDFEWYLDDSEALSTLKDFRKPLFDVDPGDHTVRLVVSDGYETIEESFTITVEEAPEEVDDRSFMEKLIDDENFFWYVLPLIVILVLIPLIIIILLISRKIRDSRRDDFIIDEDRTMDMSDAEETARRILENMSNGGPEFEMEAEAEIDSDGFDFDYNLYEVLDVEPSATGAEIKKRYRKMAAYYHPDRVSQHKEVSEIDAREEMVKVNKAKEILLDPELRADYDTYIEESDFDMDMGEMEEDGEDYDDDWG